MADVLENALNVVGETEYSPHDHPDEWNAIAWLSMDNDELARCSASLGLDANLVPLSSQHLGGVRMPTDEEFDSLRQAADDLAVEHAGKKFVNAWKKEHRS